MVNEGSKFLLKHLSFRRYCKNSCKRQKPFPPIIVVESLRFVIYIGSYNLFINRIV